MNDYLSEVADDYPDIDPKAIKKVIQLGLKNYQGLIADGLDVKLSNTQDYSKYQLIVVGASPSTQKGINTRAKLLKGKLQKLRNKWKKQ